MTSDCRVYWASHGCGLPRGHDGYHVCTDCTQAEDYDASNSKEVGVYPYYGVGTTDFYGEDANVASPRGRCWPRR